MRSSSSWRVLAALALSFTACGSGTTASTPGSGGASSTAITATTATTTRPSPTCGGDAGMPCGPDTYEALTLSTSPPTFAVLKASPSRSLCFRITVLDGPGMGLSGFSGDVTVESGLVTGDATDCEVSGAPLPPPGGPTYPVVSGHGSVSMSAPPGCTATVAATLVFSGAPAWVPPSEALDADALAILGGCP